MNDVVKHVSPTSSSRRVTMLIDCERCEVQGQACGDCVVTVLLGPMPAVAERVELDADERAAIDVLAVSGLVPPLRLVLPGELPAGQAQAGHENHENHENHAGTPVTRRRAAG
jgi:hypothetical protein